MTAKIFHFKSKGDAAKSSASAAPQGKLRLHKLQGYIFRNTRMLRVWLPPEYDRRGKTRYPVLYLNDGQNLFDPATAFAGVHWQAGETAARLIRQKKIPPLILVGIDNAGKNRLREYLPYRSADPCVVAPQGQQYPAFLQREVMPLIEANYPVAKGAENTGLGGSSLGGLIALYTQLAVPGVFGRLLIESPSLDVADGRILEECRRFHDWPLQIYLGTGTRELGDPAKDKKIVDDVRALEALLHAAGMDRRRLKVQIEEGATHTESAWAKRFPAALEFLFGGLA